MGVLAFAVAGVGFVSTPVGAQDHPSFDIPLDTVERGEAGSELLLATEPVPDDDVGRGCDVMVEGANNSSVHPDTDLVVRSGDSEVVLHDVEDEPDGRTEATDMLTLGTEIAVFVRFGPDEVFSGGLVMTLDCPTPPPPTTAPPGPAPTAPPAEPVVGEPDFTG